MAEKYAVATGNWSAGATWNGGTKPSAGDDVYANGYTVTVDEDTPDTLATLSTRAGTTAVAGGKFLVTGTRAIYATNVYAGTEHCIEFTGAGGTTFTLDAAGGVIQGSNATNSKYGLYVNGAGTCNVTGDPGAAGGSNRYGIACANASATINITGDPTPNTSAACASLAGGGGTWTITGSTEGGAAAAVSILGGGTWNFVGDVIGGTNPAISATSACTINITGDPTAGATPAVSVTASAAVTVEITGTPTASSSAPAVACTSLLHSVYVSGSLVNNSSWMAVYAPRVFLETPTALTWAFKEWDGTTTFNLYSADVVPGMPDEADVRDATVFGPSNELTGTLAVPGAASVLDGVPVDATVGTLQVNRIGVHRVGR